jgi:hypothetical protein
MMKLEMISPLPSIKKQNLPLQFPGVGQLKTKGLLPLATEQQQGQSAHRSQGQCGGFRDCSNNNLAIG